METLIDQTVLAQSLEEKIPYEFSRYYLVKPLEPVMVKKEFSTPVAKGEPSKTEDGLEVSDYDEVKTEVKEVESDYTRGVVLKVPVEIAAAPENPEFPRLNVNVGDIVVFNSRYKIYFDLLKDSQLVSYHDIICKITSDESK